MIYLLPCGDETADHYAYSVKLDGTMFKLSFRWNARAAGWYIDVEDAAGTVLLAGRRLALGVLIGARDVGPTLPKGLIRVVDTSGQSLEAGRNDLGNRVAVAYYDYAECVAEGLYG